MDTSGTSVVQVTATDADDPSYGNSARVIYSILQGQPYFSVEPETGQESWISVYLFNNLYDLYKLKKKKGTTPEHYTHRRVMMPQLKV